MPFVFKLTDIKKIAKLLRTTPKVMGSNYRFAVGDDNGKGKLILEVYPNIRIGSRRGNLISVYTAASHLQLHFCSGYVQSEMLGEVTFVGEHSGMLSGLTIERQGACSLYANVDRTLLSGDFTQLGPEVMLSGISLSLTDSILDSPPAAKRRVSRQRKRVRTR